MCAINGYTNYFSKKCNIDAMNFQNSRRGPDYTGTFVDSLISLGHNLLSISEYTVQPYITDKNNVLLFNGEIYDNINDTKYLANLLDFYGIDCLKNIDGSFSLAYYEKEKEKITLVRDHFGTRPLFYIHNSSGLAFSSSLDSLNVLVDLETNDSLIDYAITNIKNVKLSSIETYFKNVKKILPGQYLTFNIRNNTLISKGWLFDYQLETKVLSDLEIKQIIKNSIKKVCTSTKSTALLLSGGLDSNVILSAATNIDFTVTTGGVGDSELHYAKLSSIFFKKINYHEVVTEDEYNRLKDLVVDALYTPIYDYNRLIPRYKAFQKCRELFSKIVITGDGGDIIFTGYDKDSKLLDKSTWIEKEKLKDMILEKYKEFPVEVLGDDFINNYKFVALITNDSLNFINDAFASSLGMETRSPFYLQSLVKEIMSLPGESKFKRLNQNLPVGISKYYLRELFRNDIPEFVSNKTEKIGWHVNFNKSTLDDFIDMSKRIKK